MPVQQASAGAPPQMMAPALPPQVQPKKADPSVFTGINGLLDMDESKKGAGFLAGLLNDTADPTLQANEFMGLGGQANGIMPGEWDWMNSGGFGGLDFGDGFGFDDFSSGGLFGGFSV